MPEPLRLYRFADAPPALQALSDHGGGEILLAVVPAAWLDEAQMLWLPHPLWVLLAADPRWRLADLWGRVQRVVQGDGALVVIVARP